jgi:hypothetical protein
MAAGEKIGIVGRTETGIFSGTNQNIINRELEGGSQKRADSGKSAFIREKTMLANSIIHRQISIAFGTFPFCGN